jgi:hypothetical protein
MLKKSLTLFLSMNSLLFSAEALTKIDLEKNQDGDTDPNILFQLVWSNNYYSYVGYTSSSSKKIKLLFGSQDSKSAIISSKNTVTLNWLTKEIKKNYSIGIQTDFIKIKNNAFGYIHDTLNIFNHGNDYWVTYNNEVNIDIQKTSLHLDYFKKTSNLFLRLSFLLSLDTQLEVKQSTIFKPLVTKTGISSDNNSQDNSYSFRFEGFYDTKKLLKFGLFYNYDFMPLKYNLAQISLNNNSYYFKNSSVESEEITQEYRFKIYFDYKVLDVFYPGITIGQTKIKTKDKIHDTSSTETSDIIGFTLQKWF